MLNAELATGIPCKLLGLTEHKLPGETEKKSLKFSSQIIDSMVEKSNFFRGRLV